MILPPEKQCVSLDIAKRMRDLGFPQESLYVWVDEFPVFNDRVRLTDIGDFKDRLATSLLSEEARALVKTYSAYTVGECGEMLPIGFTLKKGEITYSAQLGSIGEAAEISANATAKLLIALKENGLI